MNSVVTSSLFSHLRTALAANSAPLSDRMYSGSPLWRHLQTFPPPYPLHSLMIHPPAVVPQQRRDPAITVASVPCGQPDDLADQPLLVIGDLALMPLRRPRLPDRPARPPFRDAHHVTYMFDGPASFGRAQKFPRFTSFKMALSNDRSATSFLSLVFSCSSSLTRV